MLRSLVFALLFPVLISAAPDVGKFEGVWKAEIQGHAYAILTILSDHPPRGTLARGSVNTNAAGQITEVTRDASMGLYIQAPKIVKGALHFKTIDPNDGVVTYEMRITSGSEATLSVNGAAPFPLKRD
jgi:hypothetical protein